MLKTERLKRKWDHIDMADIQLDKLALHFAHAKKAEGRSLATVAWYGEKLSDFMSFLERIGTTATLSHFTPLAVREYVVNEQGRGISPYTIQGKARTLKVFASWLKDEGYTPGNVLDTVKVPKVPVKVIEPLTTEEIERLLSARNALTAIGSRDIAILITLLDTGIRAGELAGLRVNDAHLEEGYLKVLGKGNKERIVPIGAVAQKVLWRYLLHFKPERLRQACDFVFLTLDGRPLTVNALKLLLNRWGRRAGVPRLHAHLCRHTYATSYLVNKCGDVFRLQNILGHTTLEMVRKYVHYASCQDMINNHSASPVDHLGIKNLRGYKVDRLLRTNKAS
jgi:site-specific recombinase XerD